MKKFYFFKKNRKILQEKVYLVGGGPEDFELITLKGYHLLCRADVILHDHLIPAELLNLFNTSVS